MIPNVQFASPSCVTVTTWVAITMLPARATAPGLASAVKVTPESPTTPDGPEVMCSQFVSIGTVAE